MLKLSDELAMATAWSCYANKRVSKQRLKDNTEGLNDVNHYNKFAQHDLLL